ncbi:MULTISPECIES: prolyl-tRNA synthetase associated domain-containing protein [unclassified Fusibacter]|uniref:prolyl-tRNA synthetase associated domain-containing protein n=1 Tax=unclassified Fusibacter TaxID=2624464 RepID=UPI001011993A|nr:MULTISPECIES: prolyl-tRNA synthetase associated domain-containing protein [unclassified Fusibacter]MCK8058453.1 prolyl-tRNA synthetase associated domain-containing protein [Fusibacter sp. A2]NPE22779.1 prolyl-tRNA synthetase associated domain-containing protein [Fusibacter sp. A1]RXV60335.1 prolyl-tRNA synthetase associated domain-containing protein [Fusibacter sp. A1]
MTDKTNNEKVYEYLKDLGIEFESVKHGPIFTCNEECPEMIGIEVMDIKNLFLRDKKGRNHYLLVVPYERAIDLKTLAVELGTTALSFASEERLLRFLGVESGAVSIFGLLNDTDSEVVLVLDKAILKPGRVGFHPNSNTETLLFDSSDLVKFVESVTNTIVYL